MHFLHPREGVADTPRNMACPTRLAAERSVSVRSIDLYHVAVPLKKPIRHASHERTTSDSLVVRVTLDDGQVGYGEGVPRPNVPGETNGSTIATLAALDLARQMGRPRDFAAVVRQLEALRLPATEADPRGMAGNAARCAGTGRARCLRPSVRHLARRGSSSRRVAGVATVRPPRVGPL